MSNVRLSTAIAILVLAACSDAAGPVDEPAPDRLIFVKAVETSPGVSPMGTLYRVDEDGTGLVQVGPPAYYHHLQPSPDGRRLAYYSDQRGCLNIHILAYDATVATQLTGVQEFERCNVQPYWSPDGARIAFTTSRNNRLPDLPDSGWDAYVMNVDGSGVLKLFDNPSASIDSSGDYAAGWAPDGRVVVRSARSGSSRIYLVNPDGSDPVDVHDVWGGIPRWSDDGGCAVVAVWGDFWVANGDGSDRRLVVDDPEWAVIPHAPWAPDGSVLAYTSLRRAGDQDVWVMKPDGSGQVNLTPTPGEDVVLQWLPDSRRILFASNRTGDWDIYVVDIEGAGLTNLTDQPGDDYAAAWLRGG